MKTQHIKTLGYYWGFPGSSDGKECPVWEIWFQSLGQKDPLKREWLSTPAIVPREFYGQRSLASYSPWGHKEWI